MGGPTGGVFGVASRPNGKPLLMFEFLRRISRQEACLEGLFARYRLSLQVPNLAGCPATLLSGDRSSQRARKSGFSGRKAEFLHPGAVGRPDSFRHSECILFRLPAAWHKRIGCYTESSGSSTAACDRAAIPPARRRDCLTARSDVRTFALFPGSLGNS